MIRLLRLASGALAVVAAALLASSHAAAQVPDNPPGGDGSPFGPRGMGQPNPHIAEFNTISKGAKVHDGGLFKLYQKDENLYAELTPQHFNKNLLCPIAIAKGSGMGGSTLNFEEQWVLYFKRVGDKVHLIRKNVHHKAKSGSPTARAVDVTYSDSVLLSLRIAGLNQMTQGVLVNLNDIFMSDFGELGLGRFDASRSVWHKVKVFPKNVELQVQATYSGGRHDDDVIDARGRTVVIHYGLAELPDGGYQPRVADDRVGHFVTAVKDFSSTSKDTAFVRYVNRWRLEPAEPVTPGRLVVPKRSIKFYIEKSVPHEHRSAVTDGILEWNKAFEKIGFRNAIEVVQQRDDEDFDPEDMNYNTFRWITTDRAFAMGPSRANPLTGEILDADIIFDGDLVRMWKHERQVMKSGDKTFEPVSPIQALDAGWGLNRDLIGRSAGWNDRATPPSGEDLRMAAFRQGVCDCRGCMRMEIGMAALAMAQPPVAPKPRAKGEKGEKDGKETPREPKEPRDPVMDELIYQAIKYVVMHEVGHTLGLRHNFKGSTMLSGAALHDQKATREKGLVGSVMDYVPVNLAPKGVKQGDFFPTTLGPYDFWAIEYAYKPISGFEDAELKKIAARGAATPGLDYGTDEDTVLASDPLINRWDLGGDVLAFAKDRMATSQELMKTMSGRVVDDGEGYQRARVAFMMLMSQYGNGAYLAARYVGGEHAYRDHRGDEKGRDPLVPVTAAQQREALKFLQDQIFTDKPFQFPPELLRKLSTDRWMHWGSDPQRTDFPLHDRVLGIQRVAMNHLLGARTLQRLQATALKTENGTRPVSVGDVFRSVTDGVWSDLPVSGKADLATSAIRRNLQREHLKRLSTLVLGEKQSSGGLFSSMSLIVLVEGSGSLPPDARSLARFHLREVAKRIEAALKAKPAGADETVVAHLEECQERIAKVLAASLQVND